MNEISRISSLLFSILGLVSVEAYAQPYVVSADNQEVTDLKTGLIWRRCAEGMSFSSGTCNGTATVYIHEAALLQAANEGKTVAWRLPNIKELGSITDRGISVVAIDSFIFPGTPRNYFWSASPVIGHSGYAWVAGYGSGGIYGAARTNNYCVRLVRAGQ